MASRYSDSEGEGGLKNIQLDPADRWLASRENPQIGG